LKNEDRESEGIMVGRSLLVGESAPPEFWGSEEFAPYWTREHLPAYCDLETVHINESHCSIGHDQDVSLVQVPNHTAGRVDRRGGASDIHCDVKKEPVVDRRERQPLFCGMSEPVYFTTA
jgi:hypothetical protein